MRSILLLSVVCLLSACGANPTDSEDPKDSVPVDDSDTGVVEEITPPLDEGKYDGVIIDHTWGAECGDMDSFVYLEVAPYTLTWTGETTFTMTDGTVTEVCTADGTTVTCDAYEVSLGAADTYEPILASEISAFEVVSATEFNQIESIVIRCEGDGCAEVESTFSITFPCTGTVTESWTHK